MTAHSAEHINENALPIIDIAALRNGDAGAREAVMVFTERYHLARGDCCGSSCRHCPFNHMNVNKEELK